MKIGAVSAATLVLLAAACAAVPTVAPERQPARVDRPIEQPPAARGGPVYDPPMAGFDARQVRRSVEAHVAARLGPDAVRRAASGASSVMVTHHAGLPRPIGNPDGSWGYEPPGANAMVRGATGWTGWSGTATRPVASARAAEIDRILADPAFWAEPDHVAPSCTDAGVRRLVVRHAGRTVVRQQSCGGRGLTGRLWELVFAGPG